jgi:hypothetical protein
MESLQPYILSLIVATAAERTPALPKPPELPYKLVAMPFKPIPEMAL